MQVKFIISIIIVIFGSLIIFLASGFKLLDLSDLDLAIADAHPGKVLGVSEASPDKSALESGYKLPENIVAAPPAKMIGPVRIASSSDYELAYGAAAVIDAVSGKVLFAQNAETPRPIASITKLAAIMVFLDYNPGWEKIYKIKADDIVSGGRIYLSPGDKVRIRDLFNLSLVCSSNSAAAALASASGLDKSAFVGQMNAKAKEFGLANMRFVEPTGLDSQDSASAYELAVFAKHALANEDISAATLSRKYSFSTLAGKKITVYNTDSLLDIFPQNGVRILAGKTGFTNSAQYCFAGSFTDKSGHELISVILGSSNRKTSFFETKNMIEWAYANYRWEE